MNALTKKYVLVQVISISQSKVVAYYDTYADAAKALESRVLKGESNIAISTRLV